VLTITVAGDHVVADFAGTSPQVKQAINVVYNYTVELVRQDVLDGLVSVEQARDAYGVALTADGALDTAETAILRTS